MVLHNDKWDKKAKRNYQRKHGILPPRKKKEEDEGEDYESESSNDSDGHEAMSDDIKEKQSSDISKPELNVLPVLGGSIANTKNNTSSSATSQRVDSISEEDEQQRLERARFARRKKQSNSWRYRDPLDDLSIHKDEEQLAEERRIAEEQRKIEEEQAATVISKLKLEDDDTVEEKYTKAIKPTTKKEFSRDDYLSWNAANNTSSTENRIQDRKSHIKQMTDIERAQFMESKEKSKHEGLVSYWKKKNDKEPEIPIKGKVIQISSQKNKDDFRDQLSTKFEQEAKKLQKDKITSNFDDDLADLLEEDNKQIQTTKKKDKGLPAFSLEDMIKTSKTESEGNRKLYNKIKIEKTEEAGEDDDFLDELLS
ncbi:hypothetical protein B5S28_g3208 [[Candida] boidinii]|nr:hypothetical protein B5S28_g3208 [[Candida] boidinii]OWB79331.1 hypothetical protein B5S32_g3550 [[Candida] boidinii]